MNAAFELLRWEWASGPLAFLCMLVLTPLVIRLAHRMGWLAYPKANRWHEQPTALMGGLAIYGAVLLTMGLWAGPPHLWPIWAGATLMFVTGLVDDLRSIRPAAKFAMQVVAALFLLYGGFVFGPDWPFWISVPLTFFWVIGVTNAVNLLDNMDGLAAGVAAIAAATLALFSIWGGLPSGTSLLLAVAGAAVGFLVYNFQPARIFMGDSGSLFLGYMIAAFALAVQGADAARGFAIYLVPVAVLAVPIFDTTLVTLLRPLAGRAVSQGGRDHSSHRLVFLGLTERHAVLTLYGISVLFGALALAFHLAEVPLFYALAIFMAVGLAVFGGHLASANVYGEAAAGKTRPKATFLQRLLAAPNTLMGQKWKNLAGVACDLLLIVAAFILAHYLRFEHGLSPAREAFLLEALPAVVAIKIVVFYAAGLYRSIWRHAGTPEIIRIGKASLVASLLAFAGLGLVFGFGQTSRAVFFIDWMIVTLAVAGSRLGFRGLRQVLASKRHQGQRVLLYGAGDAGLITLRELRQNVHQGLVPVGFLDDDPAKCGCSVQGLRIYGGLDALSDACTRHQVEEVLITATRMSAERREAICARCAEAGLRCRSFRLFFEAAHPPTGDGARGTREAVHVETLPR